MDPHTTQVVTKKVVQGVSRQEAEAVRNPIGLIGCIKVVRFRSFPQVTNRLGPFLISSGPDTKSDTIKSVGSILLEDEGVVDAVRLALASADFDIMRKASLLKSG